MTEIDNKWNSFAVSGKIKDYLDYCNLKDGNCLGENERKTFERRTCGKRNERG